MDWNPAIELGLAVQTNGATSLNPDINPDKNNFPRKSHLPYGRFVVSIGTSTQVLTYGPNRPQTGVQANYFLGKK